ncbi:MAG: N-acetylmuramoyl-L-alanine amidase [Xanthobacteraceae bacterium]
MNARGRAAGLRSTGFRRGGFVLLVLAPLMAAPDSVRGEVAGVHATRLGAAKCTRAAFRVVVDVGHTAQQPGAISARGVGEFDFNLWLAKRIEAALKEKGFTKTVLLVRTGPNRAELPDRVAAANALRGDLLLSIHHDSVPTLLIETWEYEGAEGRFSDRFKGHSIFISGENVQYQRSLAFARLLGRQMKARGLAYTSHYTDKIMGNRRRALVDKETGVYRFDQLIVLMGTRMPAALLEAGSIVNRDEELAMQSPERQALIAAAVTEAVEGFCASARSRLPSGAGRIWRL